MEILKNCGCQKDFICIYCFANKKYEPGTTINIKLPAYPNFENNSEKKFTGNIYEGEYEKLDKNILKLEMKRSG